MRKRRVDDLEPQRPQVAELEQALAARERVVQEQGAKLDLNQA